jgi:c-di-GMP-binding flagellar brake protein YcgR
MNTLDRIKPTLTTNTLQIETGTEVMIKIGGGDKSVRTILVGEEPDHYLIVQAPKTEDIESKLLNGNLVNVSYLFSGRIYGFESSVLNLVVVPSPLMFLSYPKTVRYWELREQQRVKCYVPSTMKTLSQEHTGMILDISSTGCLFSIKIANGVEPASIGVGEKAKLFFVIPGLDHSFEVSGQVMNALQNGRKFDFGIRFYNVTKEISEPLQQYIKIMMDFRTKS